MRIKIPHYTLAEELINAISHGVGALLSIAGLVLMLVRAHRPLQYVSASIFGTTMILLYVISCVYHALSPRLTGKKVLRVLDHCTVFLLVLGTYIPVVLLGVGGVLGWVLFGIVTAVTIVGIIFSAINVDKFQKLEVACHLVNGWSVLLGIIPLSQHMGWPGVIMLISGGVAYSIGAALYNIGAKHKYVHSVFHFFCLLGTFLQWLSIYLYLM